MATEFCQKCQQTHPGRTCDYDEKGECAETLDVDETSGPSVEVSEKRPVPAKALPSKGSRSRSYENEFQAELANDPNYQTAIAERGEVRYHQGGAIPTRRNN
jgi:hypothetical protein